MYDFKCACGWEGEGFTHRGQPYRCPQCSGSPEIIFKAGSTPSVIGDDIPGGMTIENISKTPLTFYSKSEYRRALKERGLMNKVEHVGSQGSDKSPHTSRWV